MAVKTGKKKKKIWYSVVASKEFNNIFIGEIPSFDSKNLVGKCINVNLFSLIREPKKQNVNIRFKISNVTDKNASCDMVGYELSSSFIKRMMRRTKSKVDDSFAVETKDKVKLRIKPFIVTKNKVQRSVLSAIKKESRDLLGKAIKERVFSSVIGDILGGRLQKEVRIKMNKIYPIAVFELRAVKRL